MKSDLKTMTRKQLEKLRADIDKALDRLAQADKKAALDAARKAAKAHGYTLDELTGGASKTPAPRNKPTPKAKQTAADGRAKVAPKFRNPQNPAETWSGRGRSPKWMADHIAAGGVKDDLAI